MKIGILTLPLHTNYGGILQAYALQTVLERMGHEVVVFNKMAKLPILPSYKKPLYYSVRLIKKILVNPHAIIRRETIARREYPIISQYTQRFINQYIHSYWITGVQDIEKAKIDAIVVGSDQIWRPRYFIKNIDKNLANAFLAFTDGWNIKRIAYAASFGVDNWEYPCILNNEHAKWANNFDRISVREDSGIKLCKDYLNVSVEKVLDPTLLLNSHDYENLVKNIDLTIEKSEGNLFCHILDNDNEKTELINKIAIEKGLKQFHIKGVEIEETNDIEQRIHKPVEAWLRAFMDAKFIITDSFHACVFSIIFHKPFIAIANKGRGNSRFESLLTMFNLRNNLLYDISEYESDYSYEIKDGTRDILNNWRMKSLDFLKLSLE